MKKAALFLALGVSTVLAQAPKTITGYITDSMCGVSHEHMNAGPDPDCVKACIRGSNGKYKYVLWDGKTQYKLADQQTPEQYAAKKVKITGTLFEKTGVLKADKIELVR